MNSDSLQLPQTVQDDAKERSESERAGQDQHILLWQRDLSDESLLLETANGSTEAIGLLFRRYRRSVLSVAKRILRDEMEAEDLCQEVFLLLSQKAKIFDPKRGTGSSWIIQIAYHRAINRRQYLEHRRHYDALEFNEELIGTGQPHLIIDEIAAKTILDKLRVELSPEQRVTLELHFFEGYSLREIAESTHQTLGCIRNRFYRGLDRLRSIVFSERNL